MTNARRRPSRVRARWRCSHSSSASSGGLLGIVFGHIALSQIKRTGEGGCGLATAGLVIGYGWIALFLGFLALAFTIGGLNGAI